MIFSSLIFIFRFLPVFLILYFLCPVKYRNVLLLLGSIVFYSFGEPRYAILVVVSAFVNFFLGKWMEKCKPAGSGRKMLLLMAIFYNVGLLFFFKYASFILENLNATGIVELPKLDITLPIGISFYTFQILSYIIDIYRGEIEAETSLINLATYLCMFPQLIAGPIVSFGKVGKELRARRCSVKDVESGLKLFTIGLGYKVLLADQFRTLWESLEQTGYENLSTPLVWIGMLTFTLQIYFDFNGYSLMAVGLGEMLGFHFPQNFNYPYVANSVTDFWKRWHITLTSWFREYIYIPLGGNRKGKIRTYFNMLIVWVITGVWHGAGWNYLLWGLYYFVLMSTERLFLKKLLDKSRIISRIYTILSVMFGWVIFAITDIDKMVMYFKRLFIMENGSDYLVYLQNYGILLVVGVFLSTPVLKKWYVGNKRKTLGVILLVIVFWCSIVSLVDAIYYPFLYFKF